MFVTFAHPAPVQRIAAGSPSSRDAAAVNL